MRRRRQSFSSGLVASVARFGGISLACAALLAGYARANAQTLDPVPKEKPKAAPEVGPQPDPNASPAKPVRRKRVRRKPKVRSDLRPMRISAEELKLQAGSNSKAGTRTASSKRKRKSKTSFKADPNAKWACDKQTVAHKPIWRGRSTLTYEFSIRNEGTADLRIKASGG